MGKAQPKGNDLKTYIYIYAAMPKGDTGTGNLDGQIQTSKVILANNCTCH